jgi:hypothetical protein
MCVCTFVRACVYVCVHVCARVCTCVYFVVYASWLLALEYSRAHVCRL